MVCLGVFSMVILKLPDEIKKMRASNRIVADILAEIRKQDKAGSDNPGPG